MHKLTNYWQWSATFYIAFLVGAASFASGQAMDCVPGETFGEWLWLKTLLVFSPMLAGIWMPRK